MKKILFVALLGLMTIANAMAAIDNTPVSQVRNTLCVAERGL